MSSTASSKPFGCFFPFQGYLRNLTAAAALFTAPACAVRYDPYLAPFDPTPGKPVAPLEVTFLDPGHGDATVLDWGRAEILIDGGLEQGALEPALPGIAFPIELAVLTHGDKDHWAGLEGLANRFAAEPEGITPILEFWEPGFARDCDSDKARQRYLDVVNLIAGLTEAKGIRRPLDKSIKPLVRRDSGPGGFIIAGETPAIKRPWLRNGYLFLLHSAHDPEHFKDCAYRRNNASIVLKAIYGGVSFLFMGDANGKARGEPQTARPSHVEKALIALDDRFPGILRADVLKVSHHGSTTANTRAFLERVNPKYAVIQASPRHGLPAPEVLAELARLKHFRSRQATRVLRTDRREGSGNDSVTCRVIRENEVTCAYPKRKGARAAAPAP